MPSIEQQMARASAAGSSGIIVAKALPPVVLQKQAHPERSERYVHINTHSVIKALEKTGFEVTSVEMTRSKRRDPLFGRHKVILRNPKAQPINVQGAMVEPTFHFLNSHDGSSGAMAMYGAFRFICSNGMVVGSTLARERVRHVGTGAEHLIERIKEMAKNTQPVFDQIERWSRIELAPGAATQFARLASQLRWGDPHRFSPEVVLASRREEDARPTLWNVFNRVQENAMRGGFVGLSASGRQATARPLSDIMATTNFNAQLWQLAEEFAALA